MYLRVPIVQYFRVNLFGINPVVEMTSGTTFTSSTSHVLLLFLAVAHSIPAMVSIVLCVLETATSITSTIYFFSLSFNTVSGLLFASTNCIVIIIIVIINQIT